MSNIIIPSTGDWNFGISAFVYEPFIMMLENMGYERNKNLLSLFMIGDNEFRPLLKIIY